MDGGARDAHNVGTMPADLSIAAQILEFIRHEGLAPGAHLPAQLLADRLRVSRSPVNEALALLHDKGVLHRERNRGFFLAQTVDQPPADLAQALGLPEGGGTAGVYFQMADDRLRGLLPDEVSEAQLKTRYGLTTGQLQAVLGRIAQEGWIQKKPGYGWEFSTMLTTPDSLLQSYRLRLALEPAALLEPGFKLDRQVLARCRAAEQHLLDGGIETDTADQLHDRGVLFHESLVEASGNAFFIDTIKRVNRVRRLLSYRSMRDRQRYKEHCLQHLELLALLEQDRNEEAATAMRNHLQATLNNLARISNLLATDPPTPP
jgi:DNA-binding GntR family transcriptional regulator